MVTSARSSARVAAVGGVALAGVLALAPAALAGTVDVSPHNYTADGTTADSYGSGNLVWTGTAAYTPVQGSYAADQAFKLDGSSYLTAPSAVVANYGTQNFSLSFRFATLSSVEQDLLSKRATCDGANALLDVRAVPAAGSQVSRVQVELFPSGGANPATLSVPVSYADGAYHTVYVQRTGTTVTLGVDNGSAQATTASVINLDSTASMQLGSGPCVGTSDGTQKLTGAIDAVQLNVSAPPTAALPEAPAAVALAASAAAVVAGFHLVRRRRATV